MSRTKLTWFALGAGTSALVGIIGDWYLRPLSFDHKWTPNIVLVEPVSSAENLSQQQSDLNMIADETGKLLRDCGARVFETTFLYDDHMPTADYPIIVENYDSLECVIKSAESKGIDFKIEIRSGSRTADEARSSN